KIEVENYDEPGVGSIGKSYIDNDSENKGGAYREDGVDIEELAAEKGSFVVGYTEKGEWLKYSVNVSTDTELFGKARVASASKGSAFHLEIDDKAVTESIVVDSIGSWTEYKEISFKTSKIEKGEHSLKLVIDGSYVNIDWINLSDSESKDTDAIRKVSVVPKTESYKVYDLKGTYLGTVRNRTAVKQLTRQKGLFVLQGKNSKMLVKVD
ncbi:MAG: carbohydrate-binding protein, partial [Fibrobacter sp.]|nr:carbohydrate-binding protein [Fibrobacter sp.]